MSYEQFNINEKKQTLGGDINKESFVKDIAQQNEPLQENFCDATVFYCQ